MSLSDPQRSPGPGWHGELCAEELLGQRAERAPRAGRSPAVLAVDLYTCVIPAPPSQDRAPIVDSRSCGVHADQARSPVRRLLAGARRAGSPIFYTTSLRRSGIMGSRAAATRRSTSPGVVAVPSDYEIHPDFTPHEGDVVLEKGRPSAFFGTPLIS